MNKKQILIQKEKTIIESFTKIYNRIKRLDENEIGDDHETSSRSVEYGINPEIGTPDLTPEVGDIYNNIPIKYTWGDGPVQIKLDKVKILSVYPETKEARVRTSGGGDAVVSFEDLGVE